MHFIKRYSKSSPRLTKGWPQVVSKLRLCFKGLCFKGLCFKGLCFKGLCFKGLFLKGLCFKGLCFKGLFLKGLFLKGLCFKGLSSSTVVLGGRLSIGLLLIGTTLGCATDNKYASLPSLTNQLVEAPTSAWLPATLLPKQDDSTYLQQGLKQLLGQTVPISREAFVNSSRLRLERQAQDPLGQQGLNGRLLVANEPNLVIALMTDGQRCYLVNPQSNLSVPVDIECLAQ